MAAGDETIPKPHWRTKVTVVVDLPVTDERTTPRSAKWDSSELVSDALSGVGGPDAIVWQVYPTEEVGACYVVD